MRKPNTVYSTSPEGSLWNEEHEIIAKLVSYLQPKKIFEFGTFCGETTNNLAENSPTDAVIYTFDLPQDTLPKQELLPADKHYVLDKKVGGKINDAYKKKIQQVFCDLGEYSFADHEDSVDLCFVDSGHDYVSVKRDTENALKLVSSGLILWHDVHTMDWPDVTKYLNERFLGVPGYHIYSGTRLAGYWV